jgi:hypothetical protein
MMMSFQGYMRGVIFVSAKTIERHHHQEMARQHMGLGADLARERRNWRAWRARMKGRLTGQMQRLP